MKAKQKRVMPFDDDGMERTEEGVQRTDPGDDELNEVFAEFPQNEACIELSRTTEKGGKPGFLEDIMPSEFSFGMVAREYGGGNYIAKGRYKDGTSIKRSFFIEGDSFPMKRKIPAVAVTVTAPVAPGVAPLEIPRGADGNPDMAALLTGMLNMMRSIVQESKGSKTEWLAEMRTMKEIFGASEKTQTPIHEAIGMIKTGIELGQSGDGGGFPWLLALDKLQGPLTELVSTIKTAVTQGRPSGSLNQNPNLNSLQPPIQPAVATSEPAKPEGDQMLMILKEALQSMLPILVTGAAKEADPGFYADLLLDQIPRSYYATAQTWLAKADCLDQLQRMNAGVTGYLVWFGLLRAELLKALTEELGGDATGPIQSQPSSDSATERAADL